EATSYWKGRLDSLTSEERTAEMKVIQNELLSNRFDLSTVVDVKFNGRVSGKADSPASKKRAQDLEKIYAEIGNLVGQASMGERLSDVETDQGSHRGMPHVS